MRRLWLACSCALMLAAHAHAETAQVMPNGCGQAGYPSVQGAQQLTQDPSGRACVSRRVTLVPLRVSTVTTGGVAVTALGAGDRTEGGFLVNPVAATVDLCINEQTTASGTTTAGALICIAGGQSYWLAPSALGVSVVTSDSAHAFGGQGFN